MQTSSLSSCRALRNYRGALRIALIYMAFAALWILLSDQAVGLIFSDPQLMTQASMIKGWLFVLVTGLLLYALVNRLVRQIEDAHGREKQILVDRQNTLDLLAVISDHSQDAIFAKDREGRYMLFNRAASEFVGKPAAEVLGKDDMAIFPPEQAKLLMDIGKRVIASKRAETNEEVLDTAQGQRIFLATKGPLYASDGSVLGLFGISRDITERKLAEISLRESEKRFHDIVNCSGDWVWEVDAQGCYTYVSDSVEQMLGYTPQEILGKTPFDLMPAKEADRIKAKFLGIVARREAFRDFDNVNVRKDGSLRYVWTNGMPILAADGQLLGYRGLDRDISERKMAEQELQSTKEMLRAVINTIPDLIWLKDRDGRYLACNQRFEAFFGAREAEIVGKTDFDFVPRELAECFRTNDRTVIAAEASRENEEEVVFASDGHREQLLTIKTPYRDAQGKVIGVLGIARNISDRKAAEASLLERNKELERFNHATLGRELDMLEMKKTINALSRELGRAPPYPLAFLKPEEGEEAP